MTRSPPELNRRRFLAFGASGALLAPTAALAAGVANPVPGADPVKDIVTADLRGSLDGTGFGLRPGAADDQSGLMQQALDAAAAEDRPLFLPPGHYVVSNISLPSRCRIVGIAGATRLVYGGGGHLFIGENCDLVHFTDVVVDGANRPLGEYVPAALHLASVRDAQISGCQVFGAAGYGIELDRCGGRITGSLVTGASEAGIRVVESTGLAITGNVISDCGNGGILVHRWEAGEDGTLVTGNRIERIRATNGGTGPFGNGINVFRAHSVTVANNRIADCAFTAVRSNSSDNVQILGNSCSRLGEVAIYSEFAFKGAIIANNVVDTAASGISIANFMDGGRMATVTGNIVRGIHGQGPYETQPPGFGIGIYVEADAAVNANVVDGASLAGLWLGWGPYLRDTAVTGNVLRDTPMGVSVSVVEGSGSAVIADNVISGAGKGAVVGMRWAETASADLAVAGAGDFPHLIVERNRVS